MPTRIILRDTAPSAVDDRGALRRIGSWDHIETSEEIIDLGPLSETSPATPSPRHFSPHIGEGRGRSALHSPRSSSSRRVSKVTGFGGFRSSILGPTYIREESTHISRSDIRASPRMQGYLFNFTASMVMLVSVIQFYVNREPDDEISRQRRLDDGNIQDSESDLDFTTTFG